MVATTAVQLHGVSGRRYSFSVYPWNTPFNSYGAIYIILRTAANGRFDLLYIGQTNALNQRFYSHHKQSCFNQQRKTHIGVLLEATEANRLQTETDLLRNYTTVCND